MQDRYTGDVGDFGKYGLLRRLCGLRDGDAEQLNLGVVWYRPPLSIVADDPADDGKHTNYLSTGPEGLYWPCDPTLYDALREIVECNSRCIEAVERAALLGPDTVFHRERVPGPVQGARGEARIVKRRIWTEGALRVTEGCDVVFLDPDNGLEPKAVPITRKMAPKYAYLEEVGKWLERCQSVVIYHHLSRNGTHPEQIAGWLERLRGEFSSHDSFALRFRRGTSRAFFVLAAERHTPILRQRADELLASPWLEHFEDHEAALAAFARRRGILEPNEGALAGG